MGGYFKRLFFILIIFFLLFIDKIFAKSFYSSLNEANSLYQKGKYDEALDKYQKLSIKFENNPILNFNRGVILYKKGQYEEALDAFNKALIYGDKKLEKDTLYNIGNCKFKLGELKLKNEPNSTLDLWHQALEYYKRAIEKDEKNLDARFNYEFVEKKIKELSENLSREQTKTTKEENKQDTEEESKKNREENSFSQRSEEKREESLEERKQEEKKFQGFNETGSNLENTQEKKPLSKEEALNLLEQYGNEEIYPEYFYKRQIGEEEPVLKDW